MTEHRHKGKAKLAAYITAILTAATPGVYGALQTAKQAWIQRQETMVRDDQEGDLQKWALANKASIAELQKTCVTHEDLVDLLLELRLNRVDRGSRRSRRSVTLGASIGVAGGVPKLKSELKSSGQKRVKVVKLPRLQHPSIVRQKVKRMLNAEDSK